MAESNYLSSNDNKITIITKDKLKKEREKIIIRAINNSYMNRDDAILVMMYLKWKSIDGDNWYNNPDSLEEKKIEAGIELSKTTKEKLNAEGVESDGDNCLLCFKDRDETFYSLNCKHQFCSECWTEYLKEKIRYPLEALRAKCPQHGCTCIVYESLYEKYLKDINEPEIQNCLKIFNNVIYVNFEDNNKKIKKCPNLKCEYCSKTNLNSYLREVFCKCGTFYCFECLKEAHRPCPCGLVTSFFKLPKPELKIISKEKAEDYNKQWIEANTKECPHCHKRIQKSYGCNYMLCDKKAGGCGKAFCYVCETDWELHSQDHFSCNKYNEIIKQKEEKAKKLNQNLMEELKDTQFDFYFRRFVLCKENLEITQTVFKNDLKEKIELLKAIYNLSNRVIKIINDAFETVIKVKTTIKYSNIYAFYMKEVDNKQKFTDSLSNLEKENEELFKLISESNLDKYIKSENIDSFKQLKEDILEQSEKVNELRNNFLNDGENKYFSDLDKNLINKS